MYSLCEKLYHTDQPFSCRYQKPIAEQTCFQYTQGRGGGITKMQNVMSAIISLWNIFFYNYLLPPTPNKKTFKTNISTHRTTISKTKI